jgi:hypothetical protein
MHQPLIIQHLFQVSSLEDVSRERLESFVEAYPTFGIGHYLLSCKLQAEGSDKFLPETQRTCLYFSNPLWLQWLLQNTNGVDGAYASGEASPAESVFVEAASLETVHVEAGHVESVQVESVHVEPAYAEPMQEERAQEEPAHIEPAYTEPAPVENAPAWEAAETPAAVSTGEADAGSAAGNVVTMAEEAFEEPSAAEQLLRSIEEARGLRESLQKFNEDFSAETAVAGETLPTEQPEIVAAPETTPATEEVVTPEAPLTHEEPTVHEQPIAAEAALVQEEPIRDVEAPFVLEETEEQSAIQETSIAAGTPVAVDAVAEQPVVESAAAEAQPAEVQPVAEEQPIAAEQPTPAEQPKPAAATQDFLFEPYHTIDYFASQGIKLTLDDNPQDSLGKQLKSFTDWLKVMRRLPQKDREVVPDRVVEETIQTIAAHSIQGKDIVTETMAEVLAKQGMREKARVVYEKLSLLNPDKRAYFAAKIEQLNIP